MTKGGKVNLEIFEGATINTPSMLCVEDYLDTLKWAASIGGLAELQSPRRREPAVLEDWVAKTPWVGFLAEDPAIRSNTSVCLKVVDPAIIAPAGGRARPTSPSKLAALLEKEGVALDIGGYRDAPPGLRIWCGATVDTDDLDALTPWLDWAFATARRRALSRPEPRLALRAAGAGEPATLPTRGPPGRSAASLPIKGRQAFTRDSHAPPKSSSPTSSPPPPSTSSTQRGVDADVQHRPFQGRADQDHRRLRRPRHPLGHQGRQGRAGRRQAA